MATETRWTREEDWWSPRTRDSRNSKQTDQVQELMRLVHSLYVQDIHGSIDIVVATNSYQCLQAGRLWCHRSFPDLGKYASRMPFPYGMMVFYEISTPFNLASPDCIICTMDNVASGKTIFTKFYIVLLLPVYFRNKQNNYWRI